MFRCPASLILFLILASAASGATYVDQNGSGNFTNIQDAINASKSGDVIVVLNGTYPENLVVDRSIVLIGVGNPVVKGSGQTDPLITITSEKVTLEDFTFRGSLNDSFDDGAVLVLADGFKLLNSTISASSGNGLCLRDSRDHRVLGNQIHDNRYSGIFVHSANFSQVNGNQVFHNAKWGIVLKGCEHDELTQNEVCENDEVGIQLVSSAYIDLVYNRIVTIQHPPLAALIYRQDMDVDGMYPGISPIRPKNLLHIKT